MTSAIDPDWAAIFASLCAAYASRGDADAVVRAFVDDAVIERMGWGPERGVIVETIAGRAAIATWLARTPAGSRFWTVGDVVADSADGASMRYGVEVDGFVGGGRWHVRALHGGRVAALAHRPNDLDDTIQDEVWAPRVREAIAAQAKVEALLRPAPAPAASAATDAADAPLSDAADAQSDPPADPATERET
jgi:hypothetical protein